MPRLCWKVSIKSTIFVILNYPEKDTTKIHRREIDDLQSQLIAQRIELEKSKEGTVWYFCIMCPVSYTMY